MLNVASCSLQDRPARSAPAASTLDAALDQIDYAFQPIVQMRTGRCHGFEALARGIDRTPFARVQTLLDSAAACGRLAEIEAALLAKAIGRFQAVPEATQLRLFLNVDPRNLAPHGLGFSLPIRRSAGIEITIEVTECRRLRPEVEATDAVDGVRRRGCRIALDDFGVGFGSLKLLYESRPDYVKVDRFFVADIDRDLRKRSIVSYLVGYAHSLGILTIAEGIETKAEFYACRDLGCDFAQGFLIQKPSLDLALVTTQSAQVQALNAADRRQPADDRQRLAELIDPLPPLKLDIRKDALLEYFGRRGSAAIAPIVDRHNIPVGLVRERDLKRFVYSRYGSELIRNENVGSSIGDLVVPCPIADLHASLERVLEAFSAGGDADGIIIMEAGEYRGFLSSQSLLRLVHDSSLARAADQNPLTRLPGNAAIGRHIEKLLADRGRAHALIYFDFDNFKPFNDTLGFRQGDRAIVMFADRLKLFASACHGFAGHVGGDDFLLALTGIDETALRRLLGDLIEAFRSDAESLYDPASRAAGRITAKDRDGRLRDFPLLAVSGVAAILSQNGSPTDIETITRAFAAHKTSAKASAEKLCIIAL
jgi:diguanylate cyclase (GGDEF)-like protein